MKYITKHRASPMAFGNKRQFVKSLEGESKIKFKPIQKMKMKSFLIKVQGITFFLSFGVS